MRKVVIFVMLLIGILISGGKNGKADTPFICAVTKGEWQNTTETLGCCCYYLVSPQTGKRQFYEAADLNNGLIGPESVKVIAWDYWPDPYITGDAFSMR